MKSSDIDRLLVRSVQEKAMRLENDRDQLVTFLLSLSLSLSLSSSAGLRRYLLSVRFSSLSSMSAIASCLFSSGSPSAIEVEALAFLGGGIWSVYTKKLVSTP